MRLVLATALLVAVSCAEASATLVYQRGGEVVVAADDGSDARALVRGRAPAVSPDGRWVAFYARGSLWLAPVSGGRPQRVWRGMPTGFFAPPVWSPDSRRLVAERRRRVVVVWVPSLRRRPIANACAGLIGAAFSPEGTRVAFGAVCNGGPSLIVTGLDGRARFVVDHVGSTPAWGAAGLAWESDNANIYEAASLIELWLLTPEGVFRRLAASSTIYDFPVGWSADGRWLLVSRQSESATGSQATLVDPATGESRDIGPVVQIVHSLSRDGSSVLALANGAVVELPVEGGEPRTLAPRGLWPSLTR